MNCPKCKLEMPDEATWQQTKHGKNWIRMPNGKWHDCTEDRPFNTSGSRSYVCHECNSKCMHCEDMDCQLCKFDSSFCTGCQAHVSVFDAR